MAKPGTRQDYWLRRVRAAEDPFDFQLAFTGAIDELSDDERLDPEWKEHFDKWEDDLRVSAPSSVFRDIKKQIESIAPVVDKEINKIALNNNTKVTMLLGAGASAPAPSNIPTVDKLLDELWNRARKIGRDDLDRLAEWSKSRGITNIEDLLTAAYIANFVAKNRGITALLDYFLFRGEQDVEETELPRFRRRSRPSIPQVDAASIALFQETLQNLFGLLTSIMISAKPNKGHEAMVKFMKNHPQTTVVTTNYDGCIDEALLIAKVPFTTGADEDMTSSDVERVTLIKMHGSINWAFCDSCQDVREFNLLNLKKSYEEDTLPYAVIGICRLCGGQRRPLLVPPLSLKFMMFPSLVSLWDMAQHRIEESDWLFVVGYSFAEADTYITKMITRSLTVNVNQKMLICDPNGRLVPNLIEKFSAHIDGFDKRRVLQAVGGCEKLLPEILGKIISNSDVSPKQKNKPKKSSRGK